jgi:ubiquinone biosynthesis protein
MHARGNRALPRLVRNRKRFEKILRTLAKYGLADWVRDWNPEYVKDLFRTADGESVAELEPAVRLRMALTELGTTFIKLGQSLSTRADLVGPEMAHELEKLQSDTPPDTPEQIRATIGSELGRPPEELFAGFTAEAMASASIGQVHAATLHDGQQVVVKVQHQGIEEKVREDLEILAALAEIAESHSPELRLYQPKATTAEFRRTLLRELDFKREERNLLQFGKNFADDHGIHFPTPYPELSTRRVLTMERLAGFSVADSERLEKEGVESKTVAERGATAYLDMIFRDGYYHADPHPGNILVLSGGVIGFLDCGMVGRLDDRTREHFENLLMAAVDKDGERLTRVVLKLGSAPPDLDREALQTEVSEFAADFTGVELTDFDLGATITAGTEIIRRFRIVMRPSISMLFKALVLLEGTSRLVDRSFSVAELLKPYYSKIVRRRFAPKKLLGRLQRSYRDWERLLDLLPGEIASILGQVQRGTVRVHLEHRGLEATANRLVYGVLAAALFLASALMLSRQVPPLIGGTSALGAAGLAVAAGLTYRLVRAVAKSGGLFRND